MSSNAPSKNYIAKSKKISTKVPSQNSLCPRNVMNAKGIIRMYKKYIYTRATSLRASSCQLRVCDAAHRSTKKMSACWRRPLCCEFSEHWLLLKATMHLFFFLSIAWHCLNPRCVNSVDAASYDFFLFLEIFHIRILSKQAFHISYFQWDTYANVRYVTMHIF